MARWILVVAVLGFAGCSAINEPIGPPSSGPFANGYIVGNETISGTPTMWQWCLPPNVPTVFKLSGSASGPYNGTLTGEGSYQVLRSRNKIMIAFDETFTITSGQRTIDVSFNWNGQHVAADCTKGVYPSSNFTYTATIKRRGNLIKTVSGSASENGIYKTSFAETLNAL